MVNCKMGEWKHELEVGHSWNLDFIWSEILMIPSKVVNITMFIIRDGHSPQKVSIFFCSTFFSHRLLIIPLGFSKITPTLCLIGLSFLELSVKIFHRRFIDHRRCERSSLLLFSVQEV